MLIRYIFGRVNIVEAGQHLGTMKHLSEYERINHSQVLAKRYTDLNETNCLRDDLNKIAME